jgi:hypothetical protein
MRRSQQATSGSGAAADAYTHRGTYTQEYKPFITTVSKEIITTRFGFNTYHVLPSLCDDFKTRMRPIFKPTTSTQDLPKNYSDLL